MLLKLLWIALLASACVALAVMGYLQTRRTRRLARRAHELGLRFSETDLFDVPRRYGAFALMRAGHSPRAHNVSHGRRDSLPVRSFDFHYEVGHGTMRATRRYLVIVVETDAEMADLLLWNHLDKASAPMDARLAEHEKVPWSFTGPAIAADAVAPILQAIAPEGVSVQSSGKTFMMCLPAHRDLLPDAAHLEIAVAAARALSEKNKEYAAETQA